MTPRSCPRLFEVEAMRDGRLAGAELVSFERHVMACVACSRETAALEALAQPLRASPSSDSDELHVRRERTRVLAAFNRALVAPERRWAARRLLLVPAALVVLVGVLLAVWRARAPEQALRGSGISVRADGAAVWSEHTDGVGKRLVVERGALWVHVEPSAGAGRLLVVLPDGELEDTGTTFTVSVTDGRTTRVAVEDGSVVLRIRGKSPIAIGAGKSWLPDARPLALSARSAEPALSPPFAPPTRTLPPLGTPAPSAALPDPSVDFRTAMAALNAGSSREAAAAFGSFIAKHPRDPRAEDAAYLRIIALQRSGDRDAAKDAALAYLRRYPKGFRRAEAESLSR
jgi:hypothetical protein